MTLKEIYEKILREGAQPAEVFEFPHDNFVLSVFRGEKKLLFSPQQHDSITGKIRTLVNMLKNDFRVLRVNAKDGNCFEVELDPRENIDSVIDYITNQSEVTV